MDPEEKGLDCKKNRPRVKVGVGWGWEWSFPNHKREGENFQASITAKRSEIDTWLLLDTNRSSMRSPTTLFHYLTLKIRVKVTQILKSYTSCTSRVRSYVTTHHVLYTNTKLYMRIPTALLDLTLSHIEKWNSWSLRFWSLISRKGGELGYILLNSKRKS